MRLLLIGGAANGAMVAISDRYRTGDEREVLHQGTVLTADTMRATDTPVMPPIARERYVLHKLIDGMMIGVVTKLGVTPQEALAQVFEVYATHSVKGPTF
jgi:hypothetical protein